MAIKLFDAELKIMQVLWKEGDITASRLVEIMRESHGWKKSTTYTQIKRCTDKGAIERSEPNYLCHPLITIEQAQEYETAELIKKMYGGVGNRLVASLLGGGILSREEIEELKRIVREME